MTFERSYKACERCDKYTQDFKEINPRESPISEVFLLWIRDQANFEAMRSLETDLNWFNDNDKIAGNNSFYKNYINLTQKALGACATCDYSSPKIADLLRKYVKPEGDSTALEADKNDK